MHLWNIKNVSLMQANLQVSTEFLWWFTPHSCIFLKENIRHNINCHLHTITRCPENPRFSWRKAASFTINHGSPGHHCTLFRLFRHLWLIIFYYFKKLAFSEPNARSLCRSRVWQAKSVYCENTENNGTTLVGKAFQLQGHWKANSWMLLRQGDHTPSACTPVPQKCAGGAGTDRKV